jgi:hypothetical protein
MKSVVLLTAMFSGLCAGAMAAPISLFNRTEPPTLPDSFNYLVIGSDFDFSSPSLPGPSFAGEDRSKPALVDNGTPEPGVPESGAEAVAPRGNGIAAFLRVADPSPVTSITAGLLFLGVFALLHRARRKRHWNRGGRARMRELTVLR